MRPASAQSFAVKYTPLTDGATTGVDTPEDQATPSRITGANAYQSALTASSAANTRPVSWSVCQTMIAAPIARATAWRVNSFIADSTATDS